MVQDPQIKPNSLELMRALLSRPSVAKDALAAFSAAYPDAPAGMIDTAVFHVVSEGIEATVDWLAAIERFLCDPSGGLDYGSLWHIVYHLYNWQQFEALLPLGRMGLSEQLADVKLFIKEGDSAAADKVLVRLMESLGGDVAPPSVG